MGVGGKFVDEVALADGLNLGMDDECTLRGGVCGNAALDEAALEAFDEKDGILGRLA